MRIAAVSRVDMTVDQINASAEFNLSTNKLQAILLVALALGAMAGLLLPIAWIALDAASNPQVIHTLAEHPGSSAMLSVGILVGLVLLTYPLRAGLAGLGGATRVQMADGMVTVVRRGLLREQRWSEPLAQFCGVTHHIRATLSGARHEIILVHQDPAKDVLVHLASRHPQDDAVYYARLLSLPELQPRELYNRRRSAPPPAPVQVQPVELGARAA